MGITIEITTSNNVTRKYANTIYNTGNGALSSGIIASVQLIEQIINDIFFLTSYSFAVFEIQQTQ